MNALNSSDITNVPGAQTVSNTGHGYSFSVNQSTQAAQTTADQKGPKNTTIRSMGGYAQIWNGFMWLTPG